MKNRTKSRILSLLLSMLMCIWLVQPVPLWAAETEDPSGAVSVSETDGAGSETTADDLQILDSTGAPASSGFTKTDDTLTITHNGTYTVVIQGTDPTSKLSIAEGFQGTVTIRNSTDDANTSERIFLFDGTSGTLTLSAMKPADVSSGTQLTNSQGEAVPVFRIDNPEGITSLLMDQLTFSFTAVPSGTALYLVPQAADHAITLTRGTAAPETLDLVWNGSAFAVRTQQANEWVTAPSIEGWTFGQTASAPAGQAKYGEIIFTYASSEDGPFEAAPPSHAGSWYLKAEIAETPDYTGLSAIVPFTVAQAESTLVILTESLDKTYDGEPPVVPEVQKTGSAKDVRFQWQKNNGSEWVPLTDASVHVGEYKVIAILDGDTNYTSASAEKTFTISVAENTWTETPAIADITYGTAPAPTAKAAFGTVQFTYSSTKDGTYGELPENAPVGTWYLKAEVPSTEDYSGLSTILEFHITKAKAPEPVIPEGLTSRQDALLYSITLSGGWGWLNSSQRVSVDSEGYMARLMVDDQNYDYSEVEGYNADGHYVDRLIPVAVAQGTNTWTEELTIDDWTYGETPSAPSAKAAHGDVIFTYGASVDGTFTDQVPTQAGIWYVKATVPASDAYAELTQTDEFVIRKAVPAPDLPKLQASYGQSLRALTLPEGFAWDDPSLAVGAVGTRSFTASYTPKDTANYESLSGLKLSVTVQKADNQWTEEPAVKGWTYGSKANTPTAKTAFGTPYFVYSSKEDGTYSTTVPSTAGTWYLKGITDGTENYNETVSKAVAFTIEPKAYEEDGSITIPKIDSSTDTSKLEIKDDDTTLKQGTDYEIKKTLKDKTMSVTITFKGNYKGTVVRTYTATDKEIEEYWAAQQKKSAQTSDENLTEFWAVLTIVSLAILLMLICIMRVRKRNHELTDF